jgi:hypothetical protein
MNKGKKMKSVISCIALYFLLLKTAFGVSRDCVNHLAEAIVDGFPDSKVHAVPHEGSRKMDFELGILRSADLLSSVERYGFLNVHQTQTKSPEYRKGRIDFEAEWIGFGSPSWADRIFGSSSPEPRMAQPSELFPKYGLINAIVPDPKLNSFKNASKGGYGDLLFILKPEILNRVTYKIGDSYGHKKETLHSISDLSALESLHKNPVENKVLKNFGYVEAQIWGTLEASDIREIWMTPRFDPDQLDGLIEFAKRRGVSLYRVGEQWETDEDGKVQKTQVLAPRKKSKQPSKQPNMKKIASAVKNAEPSHERDLLIDLMAQRLFLDEKLPEEIKDQVRQKIHEQRKSLMDLLLNQQSSPSLSAAALKCLATEPWEQRWLGPSEFRSIMKRLDDPLVMIEVRKALPNVDALVDQFKLFRTNKSVDVKKLKSFYKRNLEQMLQMSLGSQSAESSKVTQHLIQSCNEEESRNYILPQIVEIENFSRFINRYYHKLNPEFVRDSINENVKQKN